MSNGHNNKDISKTYQCRWCGFNTNTLKKLHQHICSKRDKKQPEKVNLNEPPNTSL